MIEKLFGSQSGTYALVMKNTCQRTAWIGRWGQLELESGYYIYIGSAFGPGGLQARIKRHLHKSMKKHWHIDYLRDYTTPYIVYYSYHPQHLEHEWAQILNKRKEMIAIAGFGSSDCQCRSHLFWTSPLVQVRKFENILDNVIAFIQIPENPI